MPDALFCDVLPFAHSTRTRKFALALKQEVPDVSVQAITLQRVGRTGIEDKRKSYDEGGVGVKQVSCPKAFSRRTKVATLLNLTLVYPWALIALAWRVLFAPARVLILGSTSLVWLGALHQKFHGSFVIVSVRERINGIRTAGSIGSLVSRAEPKMTRYLARPDVLSVCVCQGHAADLELAGARRPLVVRNAPMSSFINTEYVPVPSLSGGLRVVLVGSLYEGRGIELLVSAVARANRAGVRVLLEVSGRASDEYARRLATLVAELGASHFVSLLGPCSPSEVRTRYERGHLGTALYEPVDLANDSLSNKLFECVASGRPVLAGDLSENVAVVDGFGLGWTVSVSEAAIADALVEISQSPPDFDELGKHCRSLAHSQLNWEREVGPLVEVVRSRLS